MESLRKYHKCRMKIVPFCCTRSDHGRDPVDPQGQMTNSLVEGKAIGLLTTN